MTEDTPTTDRVADSFQQLKAVAAELNAVSGELGKYIAALDEGLQRLNLGVQAWVTIREFEERDGNYWRLQLGYAKVHRTWGIALSEVRGSYTDESCDEETWLFANAPRPHRVDAVDKLPDLLSTLIELARKTSAELREKIAKAQQIAAAFRAPRPSAAAQARALEETTAGDAARALLKAQRK